MHEYLDTHTFQRTLAIQSTLLLFLVNAQRAFGEEVTTINTAGDLLVRQFISLVNKDFSHNHAVGHYADKLGVTAGHLADTIAALTNRTPHDFIHRRIVLEAKRLLVHTNHPASHIALLLSFPDASYFGRFFKREVGESPNQFRSKFR